MARHRRIRRTPQERFRDDAAKVIGLRSAGQLIRQDPWLIAWFGIHLVAAFGLYATAMAALGRFNSFWLWSWTAVAAAVLSFAVRLHRRRELLHLVGYMSGRGQRVFPR